MEKIIIEPMSLSDIVYGPLKVELDCEGEKILSSKVEYGFLHRGVEKICENKNWYSVFPIIDRVDFTSALFANWAYCLCVEDLLKIKVSERSEHIRVLVAELARISSHLLFVASIAKTVGSSTVFQYALREREKVIDLFEMLAGSRLLYGYIRVGGVSVDVTEGFIEKTKEFIDKFYLRIKEFNDLLSYNAVFLARTSNVGIISKEQIYSHGISGPVMRASGIKLDLRKSDNYSIYSKFEFDVPLGSGEKGTLGDCFDRYIIRMREIEQSLSILRDAVRKIPIGPYVADLDLKVKINGSVQKFVESPKGEISCFIKGNGSSVLDRVHFKMPSMNNLSVFEKILKGHLLMDVPVILASLDINISEVDK